MRLIHRNWIFNLKAQYQLQIAAMIVTHNKIHHQAMTMIAAMIVTHNKIHHQTTKKKLKQKIIASRTNPLLEQIRNTVNGTLFASGIVVP